MAKRIPSILRRPRATPESRSVRGEELWLPAPTLAGVTITPDSALTLTAAYACINVLATDTACLDFGAYQRLPDGSKRPRPDHPVDELIRSTPDPTTVESTAINFRQAQMGHTLGWGNGYAEVRRKQRGTPLSLHLLDPSTTRPRRDADGRLYYELDGGAKTLAPANVLHVAGLGWDGVMGYSPPKMARQAMALGLAAEAFGASFFGNGSHANGFLKSPKRLSPEAVKRLREDHERLHQGPANSGRIGVLEDGVEFVKTSIDPEDAQFLETRKFQVIEVCRIYRVPPHKVCDYSQSHLANVEESNIDYLMTSLLPWLVIIEQQYTLKLFSRAERAQGLCVEHNMSSLLRGNMQARAQFYREMFAMGVFSVDDIRHREGLNPIGEAAGGSKRFVPLNMVTLEEAGEAADPAGPAGPPAAEPSETDADADPDPDDPGEGDPDAGA